MRDARDGSKARIYISHHHSPYENDFTARLEADLSAARADVRKYYDSVTRDAFVQMMLESRATRQFFLVVITPEAVESPFVQREVSVALRERAAGRMLAVIPIILQPTPLDEIPDPWRQLLWIDATQGYESAHQEVLAAVGLTGPVLSDPMAASDAGRWQRSNPGASRPDTPSQPLPIAGERDRREAAEPDTGPLAPLPHANEPDTGQLPPLARADEPDTGPLPPLSPPPISEPPTTEGRAAEYDQLPGGVAEHAGGASWGGQGGNAAPDGTPMGQAKSAEPVEAERAEPETDAPTAETSPEEADPDQTSRGGWYDGSLWDMRPDPASEPTRQTDAPAAEPPAQEAERLGRAASEEQERLGRAASVIGGLAHDDTDEETAPLPPPSPDAQPPTNSAPAQEPTQSGEVALEPPAPTLGEAEPAPLAQPTPWYADASSSPQAPPDSVLNSPYHSPLEAPPGARSWPTEPTAGPGANRGGASGSSRGAPAAISLERVAFTAYHPKEVQRARSAPLLVYLALDEAGALAQVAAQAAERLAGRLDQYRAGIADQRLTLRRGTKLRIIPTIPGFHVNPQWMDVTWDEDAQQHEFSIRADHALTDHAAEGAVRVYQGLTLRAEIPLSIFVFDGTAAKLTPELFASAVARAYRRVFASYSHHDTPVVESCEAAAEAMGDRYLRDVMTLQSGQLWNSQLMKMITEADVFQLFWSKNASRSGYVRQEWEYALMLQASRPGFIRPVYWTTMPFAIPSELNPLHFEPLDLSALGWGPVRRFFYVIQAH